MAGGMMGGMPGMGGARRKPRTGNLAKEKAKEREEREERRKQALLAGEDVPKEDAEEEEETEGEEEQGLVGLRLVSVVGELDHKKLRENYAKALKVGFEAAQPHYLRLDAERQEMNDDGTWPDEWEAVDRKANQLVLDNITEQEEELTPDEVRLEGLVDMLPFFRSGYWRAVHLTKLVPPEKKATAKAKKGTGGSVGGGNPMMEQMAGMQDRGKQLSQMMSGMPRGIGGSGGYPGMGSGGAMMGRMGSGGAMMGGMGLGGSGDRKSGV